jgi:7-cyano-7-deazaguanine synthase
VLLSGGVDSSTVLAIARDAGFDCIALSFDYGQRHRVELELAKRVAESIGVAEHRIVVIDMRAIGGSALTDEIDVPKDRDLASGLNIPPPSEGGGQVSRGDSPGREVGGAHLQVWTREQSFAPHPPPSPLPQGRGSREHRALQQDDIPVTYVPARNTIFLSVALGVAEACGASDIFIGVNAVDYSGYPDCRPAFIVAFERLANLATKAGVEGERFRIHAPLLRMTKKEIIERGAALGVDYGLTMSCYDPQVVGDTIRVCGRCDSCRLRAEGFRAAGVPDPAMSAQ